MGEEQKKEEQRPEEKASDLMMKLQEKMEKLAEKLETSHIREYVELNKKPWLIFLQSLLSGIGRGFGIAIGMTLIAAVVIVILTKVLAQLITLPFVGQQIAQLVEMVNQYLKEGSKLDIKSLQ
jgi:hypothetical protein